MAIRNTFTGFCLCVVCIFLGISTAWAQGPLERSRDRAVVWGAAINLIPDNPGYAMRPSVSADGATVLYLNDQAGSTDTQKEIKIVEYSAGKWGTPKVLADNGINDTGNFIWMPRYTHPVLSGNGNVIAYLGYTAGTGKNEIYLIDRTSGEWGAPYVLPTGFENHHYWMSISEDGNTLAYTDYPNPFSGGSTLYVSTRTNGTWGSPVAVSEADKGSPQQVSINADATKLAWAQNYRLVYAEKEGGTWKTPEWLTGEEYHETYYLFVDYPRVITDGSAVFYRITKVEGSTETEQYHYVIRRSGEGWAVPEKVNPTVLIPSIYLDGPAAVNATGTRLVYHRGLVTGDLMYASVLEMAEYEKGAWTTRLVTNTSSGYDRDPKLTPDGNTLVYDGPLPSGYTAIWLKETSQAAAYTLTAEKKGAGAGTITSSPYGILCGPDCSAEFAKGTKVTMTPVPERGSVFSGWTGGCKGVQACTVTMNSDITATAAFDDHSCTYALSPRTKTFNPAWGAQNVTATGKDGKNKVICAEPDASPSDSSWISAYGMTWKNNKKTVRVTVTANTTSSERTGSVTIGGETLGVTQKAAPCVITTLSPGSLSIPVEGGTGYSFNLTVSPKDCAWTVAANKPWITLVTTSGAGDQAVLYDVAPNGLKKSQTATITVTLTKSGKKKTHTAKQSGK